jgi:hypothetical protein
MPCGSPIALRSALEVRLQNERYVGCSCHRQGIGSRLSSWLSREREP